MKTELIPKLTRPQIVALQAVHDGKVTHRWHAFGNFYQGPPGLGSRSYDSLEHMHLIRDGQGSTYATTHSVVLTVLGFATLQANP